jgi:hypothetical protein
VENENHLATAEDFRKAAEAARAQSERVVLPKLGKAVRLSRPAPMWFVFRGRLPQSLALRAFPGTGEADPENAGSSAAQDLERLADWIIALLGEVVVEPRVSLSPGPGEIAPELLDAEDVNFIIRWAYGEVGSDARDDLAPFRPERPVAPAGSGGPDLGVPSQ